MPELSSGSIDTRLTAIEMQLDAHGEMLGRLLRSIDGDNGSPGYRVRIDRLERSWKLATVAFTLMGGLVGTAIGAAIERFAGG